MDVDCQSTLPQLFILVSHPLYICKHNLQAAINKEDCELIAENFQS